MTGGRAIAFSGGRTIAALRLEPDIKTNSLFGAFRVQIFEQSATVELTAPLPPGGALISAICSDQEDPDDSPLYSVLVPPRRLVFEVIPLNSYDCDARALPGTVPPTDTLAGSPLGPSSGGWPTVLVVLAGVIAASLLIVARGRRVALLHRS